MQNLRLRPDAVEPTATGVFLRELNLHWTNNAGLREGTGRRYLPTIRRFLVAQFPTGEIDWTTVTPTAIASFVTTELRRYSNRSTQRRRLHNCIRGLLRYVRLKYSLSAGTELLLPRLPYWRQAHLPQRLSESQLQSFLARCTGQLPCDLRCRSLLLLFTRLGMRTGEVAALAIDDIDWTNGSIVIKVVRIDGIVRCRCRLMSGRCPGCPSTISAEPTTRRYATHDISGFSPSLQSYAELRQSKSWKSANCCGRQAHLACGWGHTFCVIPLRAPW